MTCDVIDPITRQSYNRDPRWIARKAEMYLKNSGIGDTAYFGAEAEFFIFDNVRFDQNQHSGFLFHRRRGGPLEFGARERQPGLPAALQGRLFSGAAHRSLSGPARPDGGNHDPVRVEHRMPSPRSGHRRAMRNRSAFRYAGEIRRQHAGLQIRDPQHRVPARQDGDLHAEAFVRRQRQRDAHPPEHLERAGNRSSRATAMRASVRWG